MRMRLKNSKSLLSCLTMLAALVGCQLQKAPGVRPATHSQDALSSSQNVQSNDLLGGQTALVDAYYDMKVTSLLGITVCQGRAHVKVNVALKTTDKNFQLFQIPEGTLDCGIIGRQINLAEVLGAFSGAQPPDVQDPIVVQNNLIAVKVIGYGLYTPPRPMMPSFIASEPDVLRSLDQTVKVHVNDTHENKQSDGQVHVKTLALGDTYKPAAMQRTFTNVLSFEVQNTGFDGVNKVPNALFDRMAFKISLNPMAVLNISFDGSVSDFMAADPQQGQAAPTSTTGTATTGATTTGSSTQGNTILSGVIGQLILGAVTKIIKVHVDMDLVKMSGLDDRAGADANDPQESIGGRPTTP